MLAADLPTPKPDSTSFNTPMIYSSLNRLFFIASSSWASYAPENSHLGLVQFAVSRSGKLSRKASNGRRTASEKVSCTSLPRSSSDLNSNRMRK